MAPLFWPILSVLSYRVSGELVGRQRQRGLVPQRRRRRRRRVAGRRQRRSAGVRARHRVRAVGQRTCSVAAAAQHRRRGGRDAVAERSRRAAVVPAGAPAAVDGVGERRLGARERLVVRRAAGTVVAGVSRARVGAATMVTGGPHHGSSIRLEAGRVVIAGVGRWRQRHRVKLLRQDVIFLHQFIQHNNGTVEANSRRHASHDTDRTVLSGLMWRCELSQPDRQTGAFCVWSASECVGRRSATAGRTPTQNVLVGRSIHTAISDKKDRRACLAARPPTRSDVVSHAKSTHAVVCCI